jgi:flagellar export protein FliJ
MAFSFKLEKVLKWKRELERKRLIVMASIQRQREMAVEGMRRLEEERRELSRKFLELKVREVFCDEFKWHAARKRWLSEEIRKQGQIILALDEKMEEARRNYAEARREREVVEKFRERMLRRFLEEQRRLDGKVLDEVGILGHLAREKEGR